MILHLLAATLAVTARAGVVAPAAVYAPPAGAWSGPLGIVFSDPATSAFLPPSLASLSLTSPEALRSAAPLVQSLTQVLALTPEALTAMAPAERKAAVELAAEDAKEAVRSKAYELAETARSLSRPDRVMDKEGRAELYAAVSRLMEMREYYGPWLDDGGKAALEEGYASASARAWAVRTSLLEPNTTSAFHKGASRPAQPAKTVYILKPTGSAEKLRTDMQNNKSGWGQNDLDALYAGYGFTLRQGGKHRMYTHPFFPQLHQSVSRQNDLPPGYAQSALKLIAELERLSAAQTITEAAPATGPPATLTMADFSILLSQPKEKVRAPMITARLSPSAPKAVAPKPEPPPLKTSPQPQKPAGLVKRVKIIWERMNGGPNR